MNNRHSNHGYFVPFNAMPFSTEKCQRFQFEHPFTCMVAGMTGSGKTVWVQSLLKQANRMINLPPERIVWCYSQWQPAYMEMLVTIPNIEFVKGIPPPLEQDSYFQVNKRNLIVFDDQMIDAGKDQRIVNLFTRGSHHRNLSVIYIVQNLFHQGKGSRSISLNSHYLVLFKNPRDKLQVLTLAKQMYPGRTDFFLKQYEGAVRRPFGYLLIDLKTTTQDDCRLRTNVLPGEERFNQAGMQENIPHELLKYLKQQNISTTPLLPAMHQLQNGMDSILSRTDLGEDEKAKEFLQLQNRYLTFKQQLNTNTLLPNGIRPEEMNTSPPEVNLSTSTGDSTTVTALSTPLNAFNVTPNLYQASTGDSTTVKALSTPLNAFNVTPNLNQASTRDSTTVTALSTPLNAFNLTPNLKQAAILQTPKALIATPPPLNPAILTPPPTVETPSPMPAAPKRKRQRIQFVNYLDDDESTKKRRSRRLRTKSHPYKYSKQEEES